MVAEVVGREGLATDTEDFSMREFVDKDGVGVSSCATRPRLSVVAANSIAK
jgi:hypothetical protein